MATRFHASLEGAQHGGKSLEQLVVFAKKSGCKGVQPSNGHITKPDGSLMSAAEVKQPFEKHGLRLDGISAHCPFWVHGTAHTGSPTIRPFISAEVAKKSPVEIQEWAQDYLLRFLDRSAEVGVKVVPMFFGVESWELATGYPWGFYQGGSGDLAYDLVGQSLYNFARRTERVRGHARQLGIDLAHEIHPGTIASTADDFLKVRSFCDGDSCMGVNADPSHCWDREPWQVRFEKVGPFIMGCHVKDHVIHEGRPLRSMEADWKKRGMQFTRLGDGVIDLVAYSQLMLDVGYADRYCKAHNCDTAPLVGEAESAYDDLDETSAQASMFIDSTLCRNLATQSFEKGMGETE